MARAKFTNKVKVNGSNLWDALASYPGGLDMADLKELTGLSHAQIRRSFEWIREVFANENDQPLVFIPGKNIYKLNTDSEESWDDMRRRIAIWETQVMRARRAVAEPSVAKFGLSTEFKRLARDMKRVEEDLADILLQSEGVANAA